MRRLAPPPWVWLLLLLSCPCRTEAAKRALLVGVNRYDKESQNLQGCVNDVRGMQELLTTRFGFPAENIRVLLDDQATKKGILEAFQSWLIDRAAQAMSRCSAGRGMAIKHETRTETKRTDSMRRSAPLT